MHIFNQVKMFSAEFYAAYFSCGAVAQSCRGLVRSEAAQRVMEDSRGDIHLQLQEGQLLGKARPNLRAASHPSALLRLAASHRTAPLRIPVRCCRLLPAPALAVMAPRPRGCAVGTPAACRPAVAAVGLPREGGVSLLVVWCVLALR